MGSDAGLEGGLTPISSDRDHGCKRFWVEKWLRSTDSFTWALNVPVTGDYEVRLQVAGRGAEIEVGGPGGSVSLPVNGGWDRLTAGVMKLPGGSCTLTARSPRPGTDLRLLSVELLPASAKRALEEQARKLRSSTKWMVEARYGLQFHWTSQSQPRHGPKKPYAQAVADFDVRTFAETVAGTGAGYVIVTTSHAEYFFPAPIRAIDAIMPGRTAERDLPADLADALGRHGIKLMLYYHVGHDDWQEPDGWWKRFGFDPVRPGRFLDNWCAIQEEIGGRYRGKLAGWFFDDGCVYYPLSPSFERLTRAAKTGNPDRLVCYNPWILPRVTEFQDYFCGEGYDFLKTTEHLPDGGSGIFTGGPQKGLQAHTNFILEQDWCHGQPDTPIAPPQVDKDTFVRDMENAIRRGIVPSVNLEIYQDGTMSPQSLEWMRAVRAAAKGKR